jgi:hypothetical protein
MPLSPPADTVETRAPAEEAGPVTVAALHEAALDYLACYAASTARLRRVLERRVRRQSPDREGIEAGRKTIAEVIATLTAQGYLEDRRYASARAESLTRQGRSRRWRKPGPSPSLPPPSPLRNDASSVPFEPRSAATRTTRKRWPGRSWRRLGAPASITAWHEPCWKRPRPRRWLQCWRRRNADLGALLARNDPRRVLSYGQVPIGFPGPDHSPSNARESAAWSRPGERCSL